MKPKLKTIDDITGVPGGFKKYLEAERAYWVKTNADRLARIRAARAKKQNPQPPL